MSVKLLLVGIFYNALSSLVLSWNLGTVRRFLEKQKDKIHAVVFCTTTSTDTEIYKRFVHWNYSLTRSCDASETCDKWIYFTHTHACFLYLNLSSLCYFFLRTTSALFSTWYTWRGDSCFKASCWCWRWEWWDNHRWTQNKDTAFTKCEKDCSKTFPNLYWSFSQQHSSSKTVGGSKYFS